MARRYDCERLVSRDALADLSLRLLGLRLCLGPRIDGNPLGPFDGLRRHRNRYGQNAIAESGVNRALVDVAIKRDLAIEAPVIALTRPPIARLTLQLLFAAHGEDSVLEQNLNVALFKTGKLYRYPVFFFGLLQIHTGPCAAASPKA